MNPQLYLTISAFFSLLLSFTQASNDVRYFTSNGVVYSYAVITSTIRPATVYVETLYYTTTRVKQVTLSNNVISSITEKITETKTSSSISTIPTSITDAVSTAVVSSEPVYVTPSVESSVSTSSTVAVTENQSVQPSSEIVSITLEPTSSSTEVANVTSTEAAATITSFVATSSVTESVCSVHTDGDEYYVTYYLTGTNQSIDAATTITSTKTAYVTMTI